MSKPGKRIAKLEKDEVNNGVALKDWIGRWSAALLPLRLPDTTTPEMARAALDVWRQIPGKLAEQTNRKGRVEGMERDIRVFQKSVTDLINAVAPNLASMSPIAGIKTLNDQLSDATSAAALRRAAAKRKLEAEAARVKAKDEVESVQIGLTRLAAALPENADLQTLETPLARREEILAAVDVSRRQLLSQAEGHEEAELRVALASFDADAAAAKIAFLEDQDTRLEVEAREAFASHKAAIAQREALEQGIGAELAAFQRRSAEAELVAASHSWAVRKLGALLLATAVERHRASKQDPLMKRAAQILSLITGGAFQGLDQELDDKDVPHLVGRRAGGGTVSVLGMSEGTRDQLYLALRLAYLEEFSTRSEPVPFIGDDLCTTFDDQRTANALEALAEISDAVQPILFTHHRHVVELARERLGEDLDLIDMT